MQSVPLDDWGVEDFAGGQLKKISKKLTRQIFEN